MVFEDRVRSWGRERLNYVNSAKVGPVGVTDVPIDEWTPFLKSDPDMQRTLMERWDEDHPFPKLIPSV